MNTNTMPAIAGAVNTPQSTPPKMSSTAQSKVVDLAETRRKKLLDQEAESIGRHSLDREGNRKPPSLQTLYARRLISGLDGQWACQSNEGTGELAHLWNGSYWKAVQDAVGIGLASDWVDEHADFAGGPHVVKACWDHALVRLRQKSPMPKPSPRALIPMEDGYVEILPEGKGLRVVAPDPDLGMTHAIKLACQTPVGQAYVPRPLPPQSRFAKFLAHAHDDPKTIALLQEQCGMTLLPGTYSSASWWYGQAGSGKSTLASIVEAMHRQVGRCNLETLGDRFSLEPLVGCSLILVDEVEADRWAEGRFKSVVSGEGQGVDRKCKQQLASFRFLAKWIITSNNAPFVRDKSMGVWRRLIVVHWNKPVPANAHDPNLVEKILAEEGQLVLDWMLEGARRIVARGRAMAEADPEFPEASRQAKLSARKGSDQVLAWIDADRVEKADTWVAMPDVYAAFKAWGARQGWSEYDMLTARQFWIGMKAQNLDDGRRSNRRVGGRQVDCVCLRIVGPRVEPVAFDLCHEDTPYFDGGPQHEDPEPS